MTRAAWNGAASTESDALTRFAAKDGVGSVGATR